MLAVTLMSEVGATEHPDLLPGDASPPKLAQLEPVAGAGWWGQVHGCSRGEETEGRGSVGKRKCIKSAAEVSES